MSVCCSEYPFCNHEGVSERTREIAILGVGAGPVVLKECHKAMPDKTVIVVDSSRSNLAHWVLDEYELIQQKKSKLSRRKRDEIVRMVERKK